MQTFEFHKLWAVAQAERRLTRRLRRYWIFLLPAYAVALIYFLYISLIHGVFSSWSATVGMLNPRYLVVAMGFFFLALFTAGIIFLSFDIRARDQRERIAETVDSRPLSNLELIGGRFLGLFISAWIPILVLCALLEFVGWLLPTLGAPFGSTIEPWNLLGFATFVAIPALAFTIALVFLVTLLLRSRVLAALLSFGILGGLIYAGLEGPPGRLAFVDVAGMYFMSMASDILPGIADLEGWLQRAGVLVLSLGLLGLAAAVHPRLDGGSRARKSAVAGGIVVLGLAGLLAAQLQRGDALVRMAQWRQAHETRAADAFPDLVALEGAVSIDPGRRLDADLRLLIRAPDGAALERAQFSLNPGFALESVTGADGEPLNADFADGLLDVELSAPLPPGDSLALRLRYGGRPDTAFAYLDSPMMPEDLPGQGDQALLGVERAIFDSRFVALMPGMHWLPASGIEPGREDQRRRPRDYFDLTLEVEVPQDWTPASAGRREGLAAPAAGRAAFRFAPPAPVPEAALVAAPFVRWQRQIADIDFEVLLHPRHTRNMEVLAPIADDVSAWVEQRLALLAEGGLRYPYGGFSVVEVPSSLLGYGGGWNMESAMAPPGMALVREAGFPTARFDIKLDVPGNTGLNPFIAISTARRENADLERVRDFFSNDLTGSNVLAAFARSLFRHQASAAGREAEVLEHLMKDLSSLATYGNRPYFSAFSFNQAVNSSITGVVARRLEDSVAEAAIGQQLASVDLWNHAMDVSLLDIDLYSDGDRNIDLFTLKAGEMAKALYHAMGGAGTARLLASLLEEHRGGAYRLEDVLEALRAQGEGLDLMLTDVLQASKLPGFVAERLEVYRLPDGAGGSPRYQLLMAIRNDERVPGYVRALWIMPDEPTNYYRSEAIRIEGESAVEFGVVLSRPPQAVHMDPYLSRNWSIFLVRSINADAVERREAEPFDGLRPIPWTPDDGRIYADDLDPGVTIVERADDGSFQPVQPPGEDVVGVDHGMRVNFGMPENWSRNLTPQSWGRYRHTYAVARAGDGDRKAVLPATLPRAGLWDLEIHLPADPRTRGRLQLEIVSADGREPLEFDTSGRPVGWHLVGQYRLPAGEVKIEVSNQTTAGLAVADAFAWTPVGAARQPSNPGDESL